MAVFLIDRVQFFVGALQLFVGALQFFIAGNQFFIGRLKLFVTGLQFFNGSLQRLPCVIEFKLQLLQMLQRAFRWLQFQLDCGTFGLLSHFDK